MELFCCMNGRRNRGLSGNPLEGRTNLRLQGRTDFSDSSPPEFDQESPLADGKNGRPHFSGQPSKSPTKNHLEVPRRGSNGLPGAFQIGQSASSKDTAREKSSEVDKNKNVSFQSEENEESDLDAESNNTSADEPEKVVSSSSRSKEHHEANTSSSKQRPSPTSDSRESTAPSRESQEKLEKKLRTEVEDYARRLRKTASKYPSGTKEGSTSGWFGISKLKERFFDIVIVDPNDRGKAKAPATSLGWWENEEESKTEEPLGVFPITSITEVVYKQDIEKGLQVKIVTNTKDKKGENVTLLMKFATAKEAKNWAADLKTFQVCFKRWSAQLPDEDRARENSAKAHMSMCTSGSTFTQQATNSSSNSKGKRGS